MNFRRVGDAHDDFCDCMDRKVVGLLFEHIQIIRNVAVCLCDSCKSVKNHLKSHNIQKTLMTTIHHLLPAQWRYGLKYWFSLLRLCRETCSSKNSSLHFHIVMRVQALPNTMVGILPLWDDGGQTTEHPEQTRQQGNRFLKKCVLCVSVLVLIFQSCVYNFTSEWWLWPQDRCYGWPKTLF